VLPAEFTRIPDDWETGFAALVKAVEHIDAHPEHWAQNIYVRRIYADELAEWQPYRRNAPALQPGVAACVAGRACLQAGDVPGSRDGEAVVVAGRRQSAGERARALLGLTVIEAGRLFSSGNSRRDVQRICEQVAEARGVDWPVPLPAWA
jgi:hypothetical protein